MMKDDVGAYIVNDRGAKVYMDISNHDFLEIPVHSEAPSLSDGLKYYVLSVGFLNGGYPLITVLVDDQPIAYRLPLDLFGWVEHLMLGYRGSMNLLPAYVVFGESTSEGRVYAEIL